MRINAIAVIADVMGEKEANTSPTAVLFIKSTHLCGLSNLVAEGTDATTAWEAEKFVRLQCVSSC